MSRSTLLFTVSETLGDNTYESELTRKDGIYTCEVFKTSKGNKRKGILETSFYFRPLRSQIRTATNAIAALEEKEEKKSSGSEKS